MISRGASVTGPPLVRSARNSAVLQWRNFATVSLRTSDVLTPEAALRAGNRITATSSSHPLRSTASHLYSGRATWNLDGHCDVPRVSRFVACLLFAPGRLLIWGRVYSGGFVPFHPRPRSISSSPSVFIGPTTISTVFAPIIPPWISDRGDCVSSARERGGVILCSTKCIPLWRSQSTIASPTRQLQSAI